MSDSFYRTIGKRWFDAASAGIGIVAISPLLVAVSIAVKLSSPGPVLFRQTRVGKDGRNFQMFKFRSMTVGSEAASRLTVAGDKRITPVGAWLRRTKIDELPQLINVVLGDMSLVGPRPEVPEYTKKYTPEQRKVLSIRPGITGPSANVYEEELLGSQQDTENFYLSTVMPAKLKIDLWYCGVMSFRYDLTLLWKTFAKLFSRIYEPYKNIPHSGPSPLESRSGEK